MRKFKTWDIRISIALCITTLLVGLIKQDFTFLAGYFAVGGWQIASMLIHISKGWFKEDYKRKLYYIIVATFIGLASLGIFIPSLLFIVMITLLFTAPVMALYYCYICYNEVYVKMQRPLSLLK